MVTEVGYARRRITPEAGGWMSGYVSRTGAAKGVHDDLWASALVINEFALVVLDLIGLHEVHCDEIRRRCTLPANQVVIHCTHTHGGPVSMPGRLGPGLDDKWLDRVTNVAIDLITEAMDAREPARLEAGYGEDIGIARNRRQNDGVVDDLLPVLVARRSDGSVIAVVASYACHPVSVGASNLYFTADYPGVVRRRLASTVGFEESGIVFLTGFAGDANVSGRSGEDSISVGTRIAGSVDVAERVGERIATGVAAAIGESVNPVPPAALQKTAMRTVRLDLLLPANAELEQMLADLESRLVEADETEKAWVQARSRWALEQLRGLAERSAAWDGVVAISQIGSVVFVALPGEPFAIAAKAIREAIATRVANATVFTIGYSNGCPGYFPSIDQYQRGGYEVDLAHMYYGMPGAFAPGSLEALVEAVDQVFTSPFFD